MDSLKRINFVFKNEEINTECINDYEEFSVLGEKFGPFEKGKKYKLRFFIASVLIKYNILKIAPNEKCDNIDLQRYAVSERDSDKLVKREQNSFLNKIKEFRIFMEKEVKEGNKPQVFLDNYNSYFTNVLDSRLLKVLRMTKSLLNVDDEKRLTDAEILIYKHFSDFLNTWRSFFLDINT
jgi:hypothetical protein